MPYKRMLVPLDGSQGSWKAFRKALLLAEEMGAEITVLSVEEHLPRYAATVDEVDEEREQQNEYFARLHREATALAEERSVELRTEVAVGHAAGEIVRHAAERGADLVVMGNTGHSGLWGVLLGSTTDRVVDHAPCDVLVVR